MPGYAAVRGENPSIRTLLNSCSRRWIIPAPLFSGENGRTAGFDKVADTKKSGTTEVFRLQWADCIPSHVFLFL